MHLLVLFDRRGRAGAALAEGAIGLATLAGVLVVSAELAPHVVRPALDWQDADRSGVGVQPLTMRGLCWELALPEGLRGVLRAEGLRLAPRRAGPFALNAARSPEMSSVALAIESADGARWSVRAPLARWEGEALALEGGCVVELHGAAPIHAERVVWRRGGDALELEQGAQRPRLALRAADGAGAPLDPWTLHRDDRR